MDRPDLYLDPRLPLFGKGITTGGATSCKGIDVLTYAATVGVFWIDKQIAELVFGVVHAMNIHANRRFFAAAQHGYSQQRSEQAPTM
jgi:hypothetical protein